LPPPPPPSPPLDIVVVVAGWLTVTCAVPWLPALFWSPLYVAVMVGVPTALSVYITWHCDEAIVQELVVNDPVDELVPKLKVPVGLNPPVSVAVHVVVDPAANDEQDTEAAVVA